MKNLCIYWYFPLIINLYSIKATSLSHEDRACSFSSAQEHKIETEKDLPYRVEHRRRRWFGLGTVD